MKTRRSLLSLIFGAAAAPTAVAVAKAMPEVPETVGAVRRMSGHELLYGRDPVIGALRPCYIRTVLPPTKWRLLDESDLRYHGAPISIIDKHLQEVLND